LDFPPLPGTGYAVASEFPVPQFGLLHVINLDKTDSGAAVSIGISGVEATMRSIRNQAEHHRKKTFREELRTMLRKHGLKYDERMLD